MACKPCYNTNGYASPQATKITSFPRPPAPPQPPLLPLPAQVASPQYSFRPASRPVSRAKKPRCYDAASAGPKKPAAPGASAPITVAAPSKKRVAPATGTEWTGTDSLYSVSPSPSSVPIPTSLLLNVMAARKAPTAYAVEVAGAAGCGVDVGATDEFRRLLRL